MFAVDWTKDIAGIPFGLKVYDDSGNLPPTEKPSNSHLPALSALVAIPLIVALVYLIQRKKTAEGTNSARAPPPDPPAETLPITLAGTSPSHRHFGSPSDAESSEDDHVLVAVTMAPSVDSDGVPLRSDHPAPATIKGEAEGLPQLKDQCRSRAHHDEAPVALARMVDETVSRGAVGEDPAIRKVCFEL